eukprot:GILI01001653.1.p1 GENE.GILI01001653.1~~GILI01001653.1.p1  ORF type:complete len:113 (-),score=16.20 GILI01001653.1:26-364(-)
MEDEGRVGGRSLMPLMLVHLVVVVIAVLAEGVEDNTNGKGKSEVLKAVLNTLRPVGHDTLHGILLEGGDSLIGDASVGNVLAPPLGKGVLSLSAGHASRRDNSTTDEAHFSL